MNKKLTPLLLITLSLCWITASNAMKKTTATKKLIAVNEEFAKKHQASFATFVADMERTKSAVQTTTKIPLLGNIVQLAARATGYGDALKDISYLDRFFQNKQRQTEVIQKLFGDRDYQEKATEFVSDVFHNLEQESDKSKPTLLKLLHEQNVKTLRQPEGTTRETLCQKVINREISDEDYFESVTLIIATIFVFENNLHKSQ